MRHQSRVAPSRRPLPGWRGYFFYRAERLRPTWTLRVIVLAAIAVVVMTRPFWTPAFAASLVCAEWSGQSDVIVIDNLDPDYHAFSRARQLRRANPPTRIVVPIQSDGGTNEIPNGTAALMAQVAHLPGVELLPIAAQEPITLNAARQLEKFLTRERVSSITVVVPGFRSQRTYLAYSSALRPAGISIRCVPVFGEKTPRNWADTWHGIEEVGLQFVKLQYYRFWVLL